MRRRLSALLLLSIIAMGACGEDWPTLGGDYNRRGYLVGDSSYDTDNIELLWSFEADGPIASGPAIADLDHDGELEIVFGSDDDSLYALDATGSLLWSFEAVGNVRSTPTIADLDLDGEPDIVFGADDGYIYALNAAGELMWKKKTGARVRSSPIVWNMGGSSRNEVVFTSGDSNAYCLTDAGEVVWEFDTQEAIESSPALYDMDNDGEREIIFGSGDNFVYALKHPPHKVWRYLTYGDITGTPAITWDGNIVVGSHEGKLYKLEIGDTGETISRRVKTADGWGTEIIGVTALLHVMNHTVSGSISSSAAVGRLDNEGHEGIVFGSRDKTLYILHHNGTLIKRYTVSKPIDASPVLTDLDGDNETEIIFGDASGMIYVIGLDASASFEYKTQGAIRAAPAVADLTGDGSLEFFVASGDGSLYVFGDKRSMDISRGMDLYETAMRYADIGSLKEAERYIDQARVVFSDMGYDEGVAMCDNYHRESEAKAFMRKAQNYYEEGDFEEARYVLDKGLKIFQEINSTDGLERSERLLKLMEADLYYREAKYFYEIGQNKNASIYASAAKKFYRSINSTEGITRTSKLQGLLKTEGKAETYIEDGLTAREEGRVDDAKMFFGFAKLSYELAGNDEGLSRMERYLRSLEALELYQKAETYYNESEYERARAFAEKAIIVYENLSMAEYEKERDTAIELYDNVMINIEAKALYDQAQEHFLAANYARSMAYANNSMALYEITGDMEGFRQAEDLYMNSKATFEMMTGGSGIRGIPYETIPFALIIFVGWLIWKKKIDIKALMQYADRMIESFKRRSERNDEGHDDAAEKKHTGGSDERVGLPSKRPARFGHRVVLIPKEKGKD